MSTIGFIGYPGTGKDAIAQELVSNYGYERIAFGDPVKQMLLDIDPAYGNSYALLDRLKREGKAFTREKLQNIGQFMRDLNKDHWIQQVEAIGIPKKAVFSDIRYFNELAYVQRNCGGYIIAVKRDGYGKVNNHQSEINTGKLLGAADAVINNNNTIERAAHEIITRIQARCL